MIMRQCYQLDMGIPIKSIVAGCLWHLAVCEVGTFVIGEGEKMTTNGGNVNRNGLPKRGSFSQFNGKFKPKAIYPAIFYRSSCCTPTPTLLHYLVAVLIFSGSIYKLYNNTGEEIFENKFGEEE